MSRRENTIIESLGVYLPPDIVSTEEVLQGCAQRIGFPLEFITGIHSRRMAGQTEFSIDLARRAIDACLAHSRYVPGDIDLLICCNISRYDDAKAFFFEPSTSVRLRQHFGFDRAIAFDVSNACAGMFTAIYIVDCCIKAGLVRRGMVVSGEYITHLTRTAQLEITGFNDPRLACLTLGDAGVALLLEGGAAGTAGLRSIDMYTAGYHSRYCIAKVTEQAHGGTIMLTDAVKLSRVAARHATAHAIHTQREGGWSTEVMDHLIMHQTSQRSISDAMAAINDQLGERVCTPQNTICNIGERGNTATTSHFVAVHDQILNGTIRDGDNVIFSINASGLTVGTALYTFDDLPERIRRGGGARPAPQMPPPPPPASRPRIRVESIGTIPEWSPGQPETLSLCRIAGEQCLELSQYPRNDIDLLIYAGVYRIDFLSEPAIAAMVAGELAMNDTVETQGQAKTFAFDICNGALGFLNACSTATEMIQAGSFSRAMIVTSEIENNAHRPGRAMLGLKETGAALILDRSPDGQTGFGPYLFRYFPEYLGTFTAYADLNSGESFLDIAKDPRLEELYLTCIADAVGDFLDANDLDLARIGRILPPQISPVFSANLAQRLCCDAEKLVTLTDDQQDYYTASVPYALQHVIENRLVDPGDIGLIIGVGTGIQVGCALYYF